MRAAALALVSAALFGASTPFAKQFLASAHPVVVAGLLYLGSGVGLLALWLARGGARTGSGLARTDWPSLAAAIVLGGAAAPVLLMLGLQRTPAADASLLLNLESVLTAVFAWVAFREATDRRIVLGMLLIVLGGVVLAWQPAEAGRAGHLGAALVAGACVCWALDNNLTRMVAGGDALFIAGLKGAVAGSANLALALALGAPLPELRIAAATMLVGLAGYGVSLVLFILALRGLGTARTGAYFSTAPFIGAAVAIAGFGEPASTNLWVAGALMAAGVYLHLTERHAHEHTHAPLAHVHRHAHDEHHQHAHDSSWDSRRPHSHEHEHPVLTHSHPHYPDLHHRHRH
jgi:drug/metabolite transporter (DMT)-like permease